MSRGKALALLWLRESWRKKRQTRASGVPCLIRKLTLNRLENLVAVPRSMFRMRWGYWRANSASWISELGKRYASVLSSTRKQAIVASSPVITLVSLKMQPLPKNMTT